MNGILFLPPTLQKIVFIMKRKDMKGDLKLVVMHCHSKKEMT